MPDLTTDEGVAAAREALSRPAFEWAPLTETEKLTRVYDLLYAEGRNPEDYHCLGIVRELNRGNTTWESARVMNRWL